MTERDQRSPTPEGLLNLKDGILEKWKQLPPEHQATMALVLFQQTLEGDYGPWLRSAAKVIGPPETESPFRFLPIVRITPSHLAQSSLTEEEIARLDDEDLMRISHAIVRHYTNDVFWEELEFVARLVLSGKDKQ